MFIYIYMNCIQWCDLLRYSAFFRLLNSIAVNYLAAKVNE